MAFEEVHDLLPVVGVKPHVAHDVIGLLGGLGIADHHPRAKLAAALKEPAVSRRGKKGLPFLRGGLALEVALDEEKVLGHHPASLTLLTTSRNIPLFIAFRVLFNARWYYPVLGVLFIDLGLTLEQYALLNVVWAVSIVCLEVPSGAVADQIGRRRILIAAGGLMVLEMALFAFAPAGSPWLFPLLLLNRILSGASEACASGADESLAYDSLDSEGRVTAWPAVLARVMRWQAAGFFVTMLLGAVLYDASLVGKFFTTLGLPAPENTLRWPLYLTLGNALLALTVALGFCEPEGGARRVRATVAGTVRQTLGAARWILTTPVALLIILTGLGMDSVIRLFLTLGSNYYRLIALPEWAYGLIGSAFAVLGFFTPRLAQSLAGRQSMGWNLTLTAVLAFVGLGITALIWPVWGVLAIIPLGVAMSLLQFFVSHYLNLSLTDSSQRATVLSFKGLAFNLAYGAAGLLFAGFTRLQGGTEAADAVFAQALRGLPWVFAALMAVVALAGLRLRGRGQ